jgi:LPXTG-motif cell wall-anchored protein
VTRWIAIAVLAATASIAAAQAPPSQTPVGGKGRKSYKLELEKYPEFERGKAVLVEGKASKEPEWFFVENLSVMQPVSVTVLTKDSSHDVKVQLGKRRWDSDFSREDSTKGKRAKLIKLRTQGELRIVVSSKDGEPRPYQLIVWAGDEVKPQNVPKIVVAKKDFKPGMKTGKAASTAPSTSGGSSSTVWAVFAIGAVVLVLGGLVVMKRRRK